MTQFVTDNPQIDTNKAITNDDYWPDLSVAELRQTQRVTASIADGEASNALQSAIYHVNHELAGFQRPAQLSDELIHHYKQAVYCYAMSQLMEDYRQLSSTGAGHNRSEEMDSRVDDYRRRSKQAIARITGKTKMNVQLI